MKHHFAFASLLALATLAAKAQGQLTILHTNDTHSTIFPLSPNLADTLKAGRGGYLRRVSVVKAERAKEPKLLLLDSGDFSQGSPYYTMFKGDVEIGLMNRMGYDAGTIGNHEFDYGMDNMARLFKRLNFPIVCANYDFTGTVLESVVKPYVILKRKGVKIGVFGLCPRLEGLVDGKNYEPIRYLDPVEKARETVATLKAAKCDIIICLSHLGWDIGGEDDAYMIARTEGIDLVLGGHSHSYLEQIAYVNNKAGKPVPVDQNGKHALFVGKVLLSLQKK